MDSRNLGYCRVSTTGQDHQLQIDALVAAGIDPDDITMETTGGTKDRPALRKLLDRLRPGDTITAWRLDRLGRSVPDLYGIIEEIEAKEARLVSLKDNIDTSSATGRLLVGLLAVLAAFERDLLIERTRAGQAVARKNGKRFGRPPKLTPQMIRQVRLAHADDGTTVEEACSALGLSRSSYYAALRMVEAEAA